MQNIWDSYSGGQAVAMRKSRSNSRAIGELSDKVANVVELLQSTFHAQQQKPAPPAAPVDPKSQVKFRALPHMQQPNLPQPVAKKAKGEPKEKDKPGKWIK